MAFSQDLLTRIIDVQWDQDVYVIIIAANNDFAKVKPPTDDKPSPARILETHAESFAAGFGVFNTSGTLISCSANAGDEFASLQTSLTADTDIRTGAGEQLHWLIVPATKDIRNNWWKYYVRPLYTDAPGYDDNNLPIAPFRWASLRTFDVGVPTNIPFTIRYRPHLADPRGSDKDMMPQMYPMSGKTQWTTNGPQTVEQKGWRVEAYTLDRDGTGVRYKTPGEWETDGIRTFDGVPFFYGLEFGKAPPLIGADQPVGS